MERDVGQLYRTQACVCYCVTVRLEKRVAHLKHEVEELRNSSQHSFSSTPTSAQSYTSDRGSFMDPAHLQVFNELLKVSHFYFYVFTTQQSRQGHYIFRLSIRGIRPFVRTDPVTMISHERLEQF